MAGGEARSVASPLNTDTGGITSPHTNEGKVGFVRNVCNIPIHTLNIWFGVNKIVRCFSLPTYTMVIQMSQ